MSLAYIPAPAAYLIGVKRVSILFIMILVGCYSKNDLSCCGLWLLRGMITLRGSRKRGRTEVKNSTPLRPHTG